jgi:serine/threonine protein kinase
MCSHKIEGSDAFRETTLPLTGAKAQDLKVHKLITKTMSSLFDLSFKEFILHVFTRDSKWVPVSVINEEKGIYEYAKIEDIKRYGIEDPEIEDARQAHSKHECAETLSSLIRQKRLDKPTTLELSIEKALKRRDDFEAGRILLVAQKQDVDLKHLLQSMIARSDPDGPDRAFLEKIARAYSAFVSLKALLPDVESHRLLKLCIYAENLFERGVNRSDAIHVKKDLDKLPYSLLVDFQNKSYSVLLKSKGSLEAYGSSGKVTSIIEVLQTGEARFAVQRVNLDDAKLTPFAIECEKRYGGVHTIAVYEKGAISKTTCTYEQFDCDLYEASGFGIPEDDEETEVSQVEASVKGKFKTLDEQLKVLLDCAMTVEKMHKDGVIHDDIKLENCLFKRIANAVFGKLIDFERAYKPREGGNPVDANSYGTLIYTSPEIISNCIYGKSYFSLPERKAQDMYAFGVMTLLLVQDYLPDSVCEWNYDIQEKIEEFYQSNGVERLEYAVGIEKSQKELPIERLEDLEMKRMKSGLSYNERLEELVLKMLHPESNKRMNIHQLILELKILRLDLAEK